MTSRHAESDAPRTSDDLVIGIGPLLHDDASDVIERAFDVEPGSWVDGASLQGRITGAVTLERIGEGILATIHGVNGVHTLECVRCLTPHVRSFSLPRAMRLFGISPIAPGGDRTGGEQEVEGLDLARQQLDLRPFLREELLIVTPQTPLCRSDCPGLCQRCGAPRTGSSCRCPSEGGTVDQQQPLSRLATLWNEQRTP